jgi:hypothetical protein
MAVVCPIDDPMITTTALFEDGGAAGIVTGLTGDNIEIEYLNAAGTPIADTVTNYAQIRFVRARIVNFDHQMFIPLISQIVRMPQFETTLPRESLGVSKEGINAC